MITVTVTTGNPIIEVSFNSNSYYFPSSTSKADYSASGDTLVLQCPPDGLSLPFNSGLFSFTIDGIAWVGTFADLAEEFNNNIFTSAIISPVPGQPTTIRSVLALTGAYVNTSAIQTTGRAQVHFDFTIDNNGGTLANNGNVIAIVQVSDDNSTWLDLNNVVAGSSLVADGAASAYQAGTVFRQFTAEYAAIAIPYTSGSLPSRAIRISYSTGYGKYYRLALRASNTSGISGGAPATFPRLTVQATLQ
jgi:hypothetical protein